MLEHFWAENSYSTQWKYYFGFSYIVYIRQFNVAEINFKIRIYLQINDLNYLYVYMNLGAGNYIISNVHTLTTFAHACEDIKSRMTRIKKMYICCARIQKANISPPSLSLFYPFHGHTTIYLACHQQWHPHFLTLLLRIRLLWNHALISRRR